MAALPCARVVGFDAGGVNLFEIVLRRGGETKLVADEILEHRAAVAANRAVSFASRRSPKFERSLTREEFPLVCAPH